MDSLPTELSGKPLEFIGRLRFANWVVLCVCVLSCFRRVRLCHSMDYIACQAPLSMGFSRQEYCHQLPFPSPGDLPNPGIKPASPALQSDSLPTEPPGKFPCSDTRSHLKIRSFHLNIQIPGLSGHMRKILQPYLFPTQSRTERCTLVQGKVGVPSSWFPLGTSALPHCHWPHRTLVLKCAGEWKPWRAQGHRNVWTCVLATSPNHISLLCRKSWIKLLSWGCSHQKLASVFKLSGNQNIIHTCFYNCTFLLRNYESPF